MTSTSMNTDRPMEDLGSSRSGIPTETVADASGQAMPPVGEVLTAETARSNLIEIVEGLKGSILHGTWRDEGGVRLKDTPEWAVFYTTPIYRLSRQSDPAGDDGSSPKTAMPTEQSAAVRDIVAERQRQVEVEGWSAVHDDEHPIGQLARAAACYALSAGRDGTDDGFFDCVVDAAIHHSWPWDRSWWKPKDRRSDLVRAGALIIAEIEHLDRVRAV